MVTICKFYDTRSYFWLNTVENDQLHKTKVVHALLNSFTNMLDYV